MKITVSGMLRRVVWYYLIDVSFVLNASLTGATCFGFRSPFSGLQSPLHTTTVP